MISLTKTTGGEVAEGAKTCRSAFLQGMISLSVLRRSIYGRLTAAAQGKV